MDDSLKIAIGCAILLFVLSALTTSGDAESAELQLGPKLVYADGAGNIIVLYNTPCTANISDSMKAKADGLPLYQTQYVNDMGTPQEATGYGCWFSHPLPTESELKDFKQENGIDEPVSDGKEKATGRLIKVVNILSEDGKLINANMNIFRPMVDEERPKGDF